jgi:outer membrane protein assembly factor BamB
VEPQGYPSKKGLFCGGISLVETNKAVKTVMVSTTHLREANGEGGELFALDPTSGKILSRFAPSPSGVGGMTAPTIDCDGRVYIGIRGKHKGVVSPAVNGRMYGLEFAKNAFKVLWNFEVEGQLDWVAPAIGAKGSLYFGSTAPFPIIGQALSYGKKETPADSSPKFYAVFD